MSLTLALNSALSGLKVNQAGLAVVSNNMANANTVGYTRQQLQQSAVVLNQHGSGVSIDGVTRSIDKFLDRTIVRQTSVYQKMAVRNEYMQRIQIQLGQPGADNSVSAKLDNFFTTFQDLADNADQVSLRGNTSRSANDLAITISNLAGNLQDLRFEADQDISRGINKLNEDLEALRKINDSIVGDYAQGKVNPGLLDQRDVIIRSIAEFMDVRVQEFEDGRVNIYTATGYSLVDTKQRYRVEYSAAGSLETFLSRGGTGAISIFPIDDRGLKAGEAIELVGPSAEGSVDTRLVNGKLRGLLEVRDVEIPKFLDTLDELSYNLRNAVNALHNQGSGFPPQDRVTGQRQTNPADVRRWAGDFTLALVKADGTPLNNPYNISPPTNVEVGGLRPLHLNLNFDSGEGQVGDHSTQTIIDEINAYYGAQQNKISLNNLNNMRLVSRTENTPPSGNLSFDLELENITGDPAQVQILGITSSSGAVTMPLGGAYTAEAGSYGRTGGLLNIDVAGAAGVFTLDIEVQVTNPVDGSVSVDTIRYTVDRAATNIKNDRYVGTTTAGSTPPTTGEAHIEVPQNPAAIAQARLVDAQGNPVAPGNPGFLQITPLRSDIYIAMSDGDSRELGDLSNNPARAGTGFGLGHYFGLNNFFDENFYTATDLRTNSAQNLSVRNDILNNPNLISTGQLAQSLQSTTNGAQPIYTFELGIGDGRIAQDLADLSLANARFEKTGLLAVTYQSFASYSASFIAAGSTEAVFAQQDERQEGVLLEGYQEKASAISGVNIDEELANTILYENAYSASARIITVVNEMLDALVNAV